ncbi:VacJ family lipoprotein [Candidatus Halobeggiatoa sp. HSG11]|nr:VacJ family lipoprotein [Candidatus Halobeggiatoa sp. HSG11]
MLNTNYYRPFLGLLILAWFVSGCSTVPTENSDPFEKINRNIYAFNKTVDKAVLKPISKGYKAITPEPINESITNFFGNLGDITIIANDLLQFKFKQAASDSGRFLLNSTFGLLGFIDLASKFDIPKHNEDFGQTLGYWGVNSGPYVVLPFLGPSSGRDAVGLGIDIFLNPRFYYTGKPMGMTSTHASWSSELVNKIDLRADLLGAEKALEKAAMDEYAYLRNAYLARRNYLVYDGDPPLEEDEFDDEFDDEEDEELEDEDEE